MPFAVVGLGLYCPLLGLDDLGAGTGSGPPPFVSPGPPGINHVAGVWESALSVMWSLNRECWPDSPFTFLNVVLESSLFRDGLCGLPAAADADDIIEEDDEGLLLGIGVLVWVQHCLGLGSGVPAPISTVLWAISFSIFSSLAISRFNLIV